MADSITTNADIVAEYPIILAEMSRLETDEMRADEWAALHKAAWRRILRDLYRRADKLEETDLGDTSELKLAAIYYVLHLAYLANELEDEKLEASRWLEKYEKEMAEQALSVGGGGEVEGGGYRTRLERS